MAAALISNRVALVAAVGEDAEGERARQSLQLAGVGVGWIKVVAEAPTGRAFICVADDGENTIVVVDGANAALLGDDLVDAAMRDAAVLLCQLETPEDTVHAALTHPFVSGAKKILNAAPAQPWTTALLPHCDMLIVNETELGQLGGAEALKAGSVAAAARAVGLRHDQALVLTLGAEGVAAWSQDEEIWIGGCPARVVDTTGAGDCFCGVLAASLAEGRPLRGALSRANVAASLSVGRAGAQGGLPTLAEIDAACVQVSGEVEAC